MESYNLIYQIDKTKKMCFFITNLKICIKIQYENTQDKKTPELINLQIEKDCSQNQKTILSIIDFQSLQQMPFSLYNNYTNGVINLSIWNEGEEENLCYYQLRMYNFKGKIQLKSMYTFTHVVFQVEDSIYFHDCQLKKIQLILNTNQYEVFQNQEYYFLIDKNKKQIRMIYIFPGITHQIVTHSNIEIISAQQIGEQIIIYIKNQQSPILISKKKFLEKIQNNYLSQKLKQPGEILYYQEISKYKFIQYQNIFAFEQNEEVRCFQFSDVQIVYIKIYVKAHFMIFAVQIQTNSILLYHFDQFEIHQFDNYTLEDYSFSSPLRYSNNNFNLAILTVKNQFSFITLLSFNPFKISLMDVKDTDDTYFEFINNALFYFRNGQIRQHYLNKIVALIETNMSYQQTLISSHELKLMSTQRLDDDIPVKILIQNNCYQIQPLQNTISLNIKKSQNLQIKISEYFQGPINNLFIKKNQKTKIRDPIQFIQEINICNNENFFCIKQQQLQKKIETQELKSRFKAIILEDNTVFQILYPNTQDQLNYVLWIQDHQFLWFSQMEDELHIQLLYCVFKDNENCLEIQSQIININIIQPLQQNIIKTKNLVRLQNTLNQIYLFINDQNFSAIDLPGDYVDIQYILQTQDNYVTFSYSENGISFQFEISIYLIDSNGFFLMFSKIITKEIEQIIPLFNRCQQIKLVSSRYNSNVTTVNLLLFINQNSFMIKIQIDVHNNSILSFHLTKQIRNPKVEYQSTFYYVDENYLIMNYLKKTMFFYDLQEDRLFYDYIYRLKSDIQMIRINTTHFISQNGLHVHLGIISQYVIDFQNLDDSNFNFVLFAENDVSNAEIPIYIIQEQPFYYHNPNIILIQLTNFFVIIVYLKRQYCKNLQRKNQQKHMGQ
ncbi:unnamed protein product [Paramecium primaurelia]|uniref:Transmembrane protein n=1 Tax=Paramecium primaurelia TaxID=5886 RepID=A0A8S1Q3X5_PARPR|nr:unnamed protein product [Paramecium primaurelia]